MGRIKMNTIFSLAPRDELIEVSNMFVTWCYLYKILEIAVKNVITEFHFCMFMNIFYVNQVVLVIPLLRDIQLLRLLMSSQNL